MRYSLVYYPTICYHHRGHKSSNECKNRDQTESSIHCLWARAGRCGQRPVRRQIRACTTTLNRRTFHLFWDICQFNILWDIAHSLSTNRLGEMLQNHFLSCTEDGLAGWPYPQECTYPTLPHHTRQDAVQAC